MQRRKNAANVASDIGCGLVGCILVSILASKRSEVKELLTGLQFTVILMGVVNSTIITAFVARHMTRFSQLVFAHFYRAACNADAV